MMPLNRNRSGRLRLVASLMTLAAVGAVITVSRVAVAEPSPAYLVDALPAGLDSATSLPDASDAIAACADCAGIVYFWSPRMPLSRRGIVEIAGAAEGLSLPLTLVSSEELADYADGGLGGATLPLADAMLEAGVLAHAPALVVYDHGRLLGPALLGYKTGAAYRSAIERRLSEIETPEAGRQAPERPRGDGVAQALRAVADHVAVGVPGAYFRWVPGRDALAYESGRRIYLLDLSDGASRVAPGYIDFVPTPDGRYFVTPGPRDGGLTFYDGDEVFEAVRQELSGSVEPIFTDARMRDQYPSVGILEREEARTRYRVLTSWFEGIVYRDYDVYVDPASGRSSVRPVGPPVVPCAGSSLSTPIMSQDGSEVAARDEATGTTKILRILNQGRCEEVVDLGVATSKVAWHLTGRRLAFRLPRRGDGRQGGAAGPGIFLYDRDSRRLTAIPGSDGASSLAFPDFIGEESVVFLVPRASRRDQSLFRVVEGIR